MRPRVFPAEGHDHHLYIVLVDGRFNEAAGIPRGRRLPSGVLAGWTGGFNEAAGIPRGRLTRSGALPTIQLSFNEAAGIPRGRLAAVGTDGISFHALQ